MPKTLQLELVTPERQVLVQEVDSLVLPGAEGSFGVLPGHLPVVAALAPGLMKITRQGGEELYALGGGYAEIMPERAVVLADTAERAEEIDMEVAERERTRAIAQLKRHVQGAAVDEAEISLQKALARLRVAELVRHQKKK